MVSTSSDQPRHDNFMQFTSKSLDDAPIQQEARLQLQGDRGRDKNRLINPGNISATGVTTTVQKACVAQHKLGYVSHQPVPSSTFICLS